MVTVPIGTLFVAGSSVQNMVTVAASTIDLTTADSANFIASVACANMRRAIPSASDMFTVESAPQQESLSRVLPVLAGRGASYPVKQAAVWILTDDASYADLGVLVSRSSFSPFGGSRMINSAEVVQAMMAIESSGLDLTRRRIWQDRRLICGGLGTKIDEGTAWCSRVLADVTSEARVTPAPQRPSPPQPQPPALPEPSPQPQTPLVPATRNWWNDPPRRVAMRWNAAYNVYSELFSSSSTFPLYRETAQLTSEYQLGPGAMLDGRDIGTTVRISRYAGVGVSRIKVDSFYKANIEGAVPHPTFLGIRRTVAGSTADVRRTEEAWHFEATVLGGGATWEASAFGGPSLFLVSQELVRTATVRETISGPTFLTFSKQLLNTDRIAGFNVGIDGAWMFARYVGLGGMFRYSRSRLVEPTVSGSTTKLIGGGVHVGFGLRFRL
jgi:hypothetical protein